MHSDDSKKRRNSMIDAGLTHEYVKECLDYDPETGLLIWMLPSLTKRTQGQDATFMGSNGYRNIWLKNKMHRAHRVIWLWWYGVMPDKEIDHIDRDKTNNKIDNLRLATPSENRVNRSQQKNNKTGLPGLRLRTTSQNDKFWSAHIGHKGIYASLGSYEKVSDAFLMYCMAKMLIHPFSYSD